MTGYAAVFAGGGLGALLRFLSIQLAGKVFPTPFPAGTLLVNAAGSLCIGFLYKLFEARAAPSELRLFLLTGFLGGYTTFSTYSLESARYLLGGAYKEAALNILLNNALCLAFVIAGLELGQR